MLKSSNWYHIYFQISSNISVQSLLWLISKHAVGWDTLHLSDHPTAFLCTCSRLNILLECGEAALQTLFWRSLILLDDITSTHCNWKCCYILKVCLPFSPPQSIAGSSSFEPWTFPIFLHLSLLGDGDSCYSSSNKFLACDFALSHLTSPWSLQSQRAFSSCSAGIQLCPHDTSQLCFISRFH